MTLARRRAAAAAAVVSRFVPSNLPHRLPRTLFRHRSRTAFELRPRRTRLSPSSSSKVMKFPPKICREKAPVCRRHQRPRPKCLPLELMSLDMREEILMQDRLHHHWQQQQQQQQQEEALQRVHLKLFRAVLSRQRIDHRHPHQQQ